MESNHRDGSTGHNKLKVLGSCIGAAWIYKDNNYRYYIMILVYTDMINATVGDMESLGITESFLVKRQVLLSAAEAAEMILRVDDIIKAAPR